MVPAPYVQATRVASPALSRGPPGSALVTQLDIQGSHGRANAAKSPLNFGLLRPSWLCSYGRSAGALGVVAADATGDGGGRGAANRPAANPPEPNSTRPISSPIRTRPVPRHRGGPATAGGAGRVGDGGRGCGAAGAGSGGPGGAAGAAGADSGGPAGTGTGAVPSPPPGHNGTAFSAPSTSGHNDSSLRRAVPPIVYASHVISHPRHAPGTALGDPRGQVGIRRRRPIR